MATYIDLMSWRYSWEQIWEMHDFLDLQDWIDWKVQVFAESQRQG